MTANFYAVELRRWLDNSDPDRMPGEALSLSHEAVKDVTAMLERGERVEAAAGEALDALGTGQMDRERAIAILRAALAPSGRAASQKPQSDRSPVADMHSAWGIIANVNNGDWTLQSAEWQQAAKAWRDLVFHAHYCDLSAPAPGPFSL